MAETRAQPAGIVHRAFYELGRTTSSTSHSSGAARTVACRLFGAGSPSADSRTVQVWFTCLDARSLEARALLDGRQQCGWVAEPLLELLACPGELVVNGGGLDAEHGGDLLTGVPAPVVEVEYHSEIARQFFERLVDDLSLPTRLPMLWLRPVRPSRPGGSRLAGDVTRSSTVGPRCCSL